MNVDLEPAARELLLGATPNPQNAATVSTLSIAISLKRIADAVELVTCHAHNSPAIRTRED